MKEVLRGLYNSIFRKLPLKFLLILLAFFSVLFASFSEGANIVRSQSYDWNNNKVDSTPLSEGETFCFSVPCDNAYYDIGDGYTKIIQDELYCIYYEDLGSDKRVNLKNECGSTKTFRYVRTLNQIQGSYIYKNSCPTMSSSACQQEYNLIPINEVNQNYCVSNNLCPSSDCPIYTGDGSWSALYINDIQHLGAGIINITIPDEISWDYTNYNNIFDLDIEGYNVDSDYINAIIGTQTYTPNESDFSKVVSEIIPLFVPGLVVLLFLYFVFRFIKKIF